MSVIQLGGQLQPGTVDTPVDARSRVETLADIANIELPYVGMIFYVRATGRSYVVKSLKSRQIGVVVVENAAIDEYAEIASENAVNCGPLVLVKPGGHSKPVWPVVEAFPDATFQESAKIVICNKSSRSRAAAWGGSSWNAVPADGLGTAYDQLPVKIDFAAAVTFSSGHLKYYWVDEDGAASDVLSMPFPAVTEPTPFAVNPVCAASAGIRVAFISAAEYNALETVDPATIYFVSGSGIFFNAVQYSNAGETQE